MQRAAEGVSSRLKQERPPRRGLFFFTSWPLTYEPAGQLPSRRTSALGSAF
jgi:hypothetical protein